MKTCVLWLRKTLRLHDNAVLSAAASCKNFDSVLPLYIADPKQLGVNFEKYGPARLRFLIESLSDLDAQFRERYQSRLIILLGNPREIFDEFAKNSGLSFTSLLCDYSSDPWDRENFSFISDSLTKKLKNIQISSLGAVHTIHDIEKTISHSSFKNPKSMKDMDKIFSLQFEKNQHGFYDIENPIEPPGKIPPLPNLAKAGLDNKASNLHSLSIPEFTDQVSAKIKTDIMSTPSYFIGGETTALARLKQKVSGKTDYVNSFRKPRTISTNTDREPNEPTTTGLSPYISTGCLSARTLWKECEKCYMQGNHAQPPESLHGQLMFREMFYLLSRSVDHWDEDRNNPMCKVIDWDEYDQEKMDAWQNGQTGFPLIDSMMRQLSTTGWMHHLGRHAVSCFLTRGQLWQHWKFGRDVFDKNLLDSDWALNNGNWLWLAGVAPFSMPYFRLYNPCPDPKSSLNVESKTADFIRYWIPELKKYPSKYIYEPHLAPQSIQKESDCITGCDYPNPIVDRKTTAKQNLAKFKDSLARNK